MAFDVPTFDTSQRNKINNQANQFALSDADIARYLQMLHSQGRQGLQDSFGAAQASIGQQFTPAMRMAQARLGAGGPLADSGYANRLNRQLQSAAFGNLSQAYGNAAAGQSQREYGSLQDLINARLSQRSAFIQQAIGGAQKKPKAGDYLASLGGSVLGSAAGAFAGGGFKF